MSEEEREGILKDRLPCEVRKKIETYKATENSKILKEVMEDVLQTERELMEEGSIPDFITNHRNRKPFIERAQKVVNQETGAESPDQKWCVRLCCSHRKSIGAAKNAERQVSNTTGTKRGMYS